MLVCVAHGPCSLAVNSIFHEAIFALHTADDASDSWIYYFSLLLFVADYDVHQADRQQQLTLT